MIFLSLVLPRNPHNGWRNQSLPHKERRVMPSIVYPLYSQALGEPFDSVISLPYLMVGQEVGK